MVQVNRGAYTPAFSIIADKNDITEKIRDRLIALRVSDEAGLVADAVELTLDDRDATFELPRAGAQLEVALGYKETDLIRMGLYQVDEIELSGPHAQLQIRGKATNFIQGEKSSGMLQTQKTRSWINSNIENIVKTIAGEHGYTAVIEKQYQNIRIVHLDQTAESDLNFLVRIAQLNGAVLKPMDNYLCFVAGNNANKANGESLPVITLSANDISQWRVSYGFREVFSTVKAKWYDRKKAEMSVVIVGEGDPLYEFEEVFYDSKVAERAAKGKLIKQQQGKASLSFSMPGYMSITAKSKLNLTEIRNGVDGFWICKKVEHELSGSGLITSVTAEPLS